MTGTFDDDELDDGEVAGTFDAGGQLGELDDEVAGGELGAFDELGQLDGNDDDVRDVGPASSSALPPWVSVLSFFAPTNSDEAEQRTPTASLMRLLPSLLRGTLIAFISVLLLLVVFLMLAGELADPE
jgi:hypothetical protein